MFHGLRKNARRYLVECGLDDSEILSMSPKLMRPYSKWAGALMVARQAAERMTSDKIMILSGAKPTAIAKKS